jgi:hypothetical protein
MEGLKGYIMNNLIYGSTAIKHWFQDFTREPKDIDMFYHKVPKEEYNRNGYYYEAHIGSVKVESFYIETFDYIIENNKHQLYVDPNFLYTIKVSHSFWDVNWDKTIHDIMFLKLKGCVLDKVLFNMLYKDWIIIHSKKNVNINKPISNFFTNTITRIYEHDYLYEVFKFREIPYHNKIRPDLNNAWCSEEMFNNLNHNERIECVLEEIYVIAFEQFILNGVPPKTSKYKSIKSIVTLITKGWFPLFIIDNIKEILDYDNTVYLNKIKELKGVK